MRLFELFLDEKRGTKELVGYRGSLEWIRKNIQPDQYSQYGVTLTKIDKIGINPRSTYNTPLGVYFYPLDYYVREVSASRLMPYPEDPKYIKIFRVDTNPESYVDLDQLKEADFKGYIHTIKTLFYQFVSSFPKDSGYLLLDRDETDEMIDDLVSDSRSLARVSTSAGRLWYVLWETSNHTWNTPGQRPFRRNTIFQAQRSSVLWNWLFRQLGILAVRDTRGIIHENEPTQGVVFDPKVIRPIRTFQVEDTRLLLPPQHESIPSKLESVIKQYIDYLYIYDARQGTEAERIRKRLSQYLTYLFKTVPQDQLVINDIDSALRFFRVARSQSSEFRQPALEIVANTTEKEYQRYRAKYIKDFDEVRNEVDNILKSPDLSNADISMLKKYINRLGYINGDLINSIVVILNDNDSDVLGHSKVKNIKKDLGDLVYQGRSLEKAIVDRLRATPGQEMII